ncbi:hypothetical protein AWB69_03187 [Caballeronia udeis]|uniref:Uncharacterized protein n=1 Tax=Caballeronia udeis TaxID=1232866 RepID=A0A158GR55_9BURK|nr:hypothetical protein AWB69_03187 [Caballeronia udeis]
MPTTVANVVPDAANNAPFVDRQVFIVPWLLT